MKTTTASQFLMNGRPSFYSIKAQELKLPGSSKPKMRGLRLMLRCRNPYALMLFFLARRHISAAQTRLHTMT